MKSKLNPKIKSDLKSKTEINTLKAKMLKDKIKSLESELGPFLITITQAGFELTEEKYNKICSELHKLIDLLLGLFTSLPVPTPEKSDHLEIRPISLKVKKKIDFGNLYLL